MYTEHTHYESSQLMVVSYLWAHGCSACVVSSSRSRQTFFGSYVLVERSSLCGVTRRTPATSHFTYSVLPVSPRGHEVQTTVSCIYAAGSGRSRRWSTAGTARRCTPSTRATSPRSWWRPQTRACPLSLALTSLLALRFPLFSFLSLSFFLFYL